jgi:hypothetical protein
MSRLRRLFDATGPLSGFGVASWFVGLAMLISILMTPNGWGWWHDAHSTQGRESGGIVEYTVNGINYSVDDVQASPNSPLRRRTVYYLSSQPSNGSLHTTFNEVLDWTLTAGPGALGAILLTTGFARRARYRKRTQSRDSHGSFGQGIPSGTIRALIERNR